MLIFLRMIRNGAFLSKSEQKQLSRVE